MKRKGPCVAAMAGFLALGGAQSASSQSAISSYPWNEAAMLTPLSRTAQAITGPVQILGASRAFASGERIALQLEHGATIELVSEFGLYAAWSLVDTSRLETAEIFRVASDPGVLPSGNRLCSESEPATFVVFHLSQNLGPTVVMSVFSSQTPPHNVLDPGLCGTFSYTFED